MRRAFALLALLAAPAAAQSTPPYRDDRSTPEALVASLYNAVGRHEWLRAWSYFRDGAAPPYPAFRDGYADTATVRLRLGAVASEGAAGTIHSEVAVALDAIGTDGTAATFAGCYHVVQVEPGVQDAPPFRPLEIAGGTLAPAAAGAPPPSTCPEPP